MIQKRQQLKETDTTVRSDTRGRHEGDRQNCPLQSPFRDAIQSLNEAMEIFDVA
jgi:hypothetical protein